jgi:hypothetical protein
VGFILALALLTINLPHITHASADEQVNVYDEQKNLVKSVVFVLGLDQYFVNGKTPGVKMDAKPFVEQGRTFVPVRYLSNALGVTDKHIGWKSPRVTLDEPGFPVVELAVGSKQLKSNGKATTMDVSPLARQGRTYLPARWVAESLGYQVDWDPKLPSVVLCYPKGADKPDITGVLEYIKVPVTPVTGETRPFSGKPLNPDNYVTYGGWAIPYEFKLPGASIMEITVDELRQKPVMMGEGKGYTIIYDVDVQKDMVRVKQSTSDLTPAVLVLAKGNDVSAQRANTLKEYNSNPFTHGYYVSYDTRPGTDTKIEDVTHIMLLYSNQVLAVKNPLYKGGNR